MDEHNAHHFWGISPAVDLGSLLPKVEGDAASALPVDQPIRILQVAPYDARHTLTTVCRAARHPLLQKQNQPVHLMVWEDSPEGLARHLLLLAVLLDGSLVARERGEMLLELHGNSVLRERAAVYLDQKARQLEALLVALTSGGARGGAGPGCADGSGDTEDVMGLRALGQMLDLSLLKFQEKDQLVETLQKWRTTVVYDMIKAWDARGRKWYGDRYDHRRNLVDWDYHMRLQAAGTPGQDPAHGSIIHFHHFRHWRMHGVAHELRDSHYNQPNRSLLSTAYGRTREFKDRSLRDVGRSVSAWGFWADILNGPYHCFGTLTEEPSFYKFTNKQYSRTAVDVAEHNIAALLHEFRTGERFTLADGSEAPRAKVARGPTSLEDLQQVTASEQRQPPGVGAGGTAATLPQPTSAGGHGAMQGDDEAQVSNSEKTPSQQGDYQRDSRQGSSIAAATAAAAAAHAARGPSEEAASPDGSSEPPAPPRPPPPPPPSPPPLQPPPHLEMHPPDNLPSEPSMRLADHTLPPQQIPPGEVPTYTSGGRASVARGMAGAGAAASARPAAAADLPAAAAVNPADAEAGGLQQAGGEGEGDVGAGGSGAPDGDAAEQGMTAEEEEETLRAAAAALDSAGRTRVAALFRLQLVTGDLAKTVTGRAKYGGMFSVLTVGHRHIHMLAPDYGLFKAAASGAVLVAENARHVLQLNKEQAAMFVTKMDELAEQAGWKKAGTRPEGVTEANEVYVKS